MKIEFNKPYITGNELAYIQQAIETNHLSGNGVFTKKCQRFFEESWGLKKCLLTTSGTDALEMCALLLDIKPEDEIIIPSFTFVSTALAFVRQGAKIVFADSREDNPNVDEGQIESLITKKTKAIVVVHYAGISCDMQKIMELSEKYNLWVIEDAAHCIESFYNGKRLGTIGHLGCFSFHETKNIHCGEGGMLIINDTRFLERAEIIWEKGTNRAKFFRGEIDKYTWVDTGSSFLPSEIVTAFLYAQIENIDYIQQRRIEIWNNYFSGLKHLHDKNLLGLPFLPEYATINGHIFYILCRSLDERTSLISFLKSSGIHPVFHYQCLHTSKFNAGKQNNQCPRSEYYQDHLLRLPLYVELEFENQQYIIQKINQFYDSAYFKG